jgi:RNA polymerase sigma factor (TIGR02999 family)
MPSSNPEARRAVDEYFRQAYDELLRLARSVRRNEPAGSLSTGTLVNAAWIKLSALPNWMAQSPAHAKGIVAQAMHKIVVNAARSRKAEKRGGGHAQFVTLSDHQGASQTLSLEDVITLETALEELQRMNPRQARVVECRFYGMTTAETAEALDLSPRTVERDWRLASAWLATQIRPETE